MTPASRDETGFTLIEVLVALVTAAIMVTILIDGATLAERRHVAATQRRQAIFLARSLLAEAAVAPPAPSTTGERNGLRWTVAQVPEMSDPRGQYGLVGIVARVSDARGHMLFEAETRRLKRLTRQ